MSNIKSSHNQLQPLSKLDYIKIIGLLIVYILFHNPLEKFISSILVDGFFDSVQSVWYNDCIFIGLFLVAVYIIIKKNIRQSKTINVAIVIFVSLYLYHRIGDDVWIFTSFSFVKVAYCDVITFGWLANFIKQFFFVYKSLPKNVEGFYNDIAIATGGGDKLGYSNYAEQIAIKINNTYSETAFAIGINGKWGSGKTSLINLIKINLVKEDYVQVDFNPWNSNNPKAIIEDFFDTLNESLKPNNLFLSRAFNTYAKKLIELNDNITNKAIKVFVDFFSSKQSATSMFEKINVDLRLLDKKIVIYIDDLDRLDKEEIVEVMRLIRNTANFYNTFFVVAYDKQYVSIALKQINDYKHDSYLEKIFQLEVSLPYYDKNLLSEELIRKLTREFPEYNEELQNILDSNLPHESHFLDKWLTSLRDVTRLTNSITLNLQNLIGEVLIVDFIKLELLNLKYPSIYKLLQNNKDEFLERTKNEHKENYYFLKSDKLKLHLKENNIISDSIELDLVCDYIEHIFGNERYDHYSADENYTGVKWPNKFKLYFAYNLLNYHLSEVEFSKARNESLEDFKTQILEWIENDLEFEVLFRLKRIKIFNSKEDFEKIILAMLYFDRYSVQTHGYDMQNLVNNLNNYSTKHYQNIAEIKDFVVSIFNSAESPYSSEASLIYALSKHTLSEPRILDNDELKQYSIKYLKSQCDQSGKFDKLIWHLFRESALTEWETTGGHTYTSKTRIPKEIYEVIKELAQIDIDGFINSIIQTNIRSDEKDEFILNYKFILKMFDDMADFKKFVWSLDASKSNFLDEFKVFFMKCEKVDFKQYVKFTFQVINLSNKFW